MTREVGGLILVWAALMALLALTLAGSYLPTGPMKSAVGYGIAVAKAALILWFFMDMRREGPIARLATGSAVVWLIILLTLLAADYASRGWILD